MTILGEMLRDDFIEEGRQETQERYNRLILCLDKDGKTSLIVKAASDPQLRLRQIPSCWKNYSRNMGFSFL